jgi:hypothetical protein
MPTPQWELQDESGRIEVLDHKDRHRQVKAIVTSPLLCSPRLRKPTLV